MNFKSFVLLLSLLQMPPVQTAQEKNTETPPAVQKCGVVEELKQIGKITGLSFGMAALYGILHDQVTAHVCHEYFTKGFHERMVNDWSSRGITGYLKNTLQTTKSPAITACIWGVVATLGMGALSAGLLNAVSRFGERKKFRAKDLVKPFGVAMAFTGACSALALWLPHPNYGGPGGYSSTTFSNVSAKELGNFMQCMSAHNTAYLVGEYSIYGVALWVLYQRLKHTPAERAEKEELMAQLKAAKKS